MKNLIRTLLIFIILITSCSQQPPPVGEKPHPRIHDLQGCSHISPYDNQKVSDILGTVTYKTRNGFYMQDKMVDEDECSSEAIYVFTEYFPSVLPGDLVEVSGVLKEFYPGLAEDKNLSITEITQPVVESISRNNVLPGAKNITQQIEKIPGTVIDDDGLQKFEIEEDGIDFFESLESMLVEVGNGYVVGPRNSYNEVILIPEKMRDQNRISSSGALLQGEQDLNPERILLNLSDVNTDKVNMGDVLSSPITGIMDYSYGNYKITVLGKALFTKNSVQVETKQIKDHDLRVATFNVENLSRFDSETKFKKITKQLIVDLEAPDIIVLNEVLDDSGIEDDGIVSSEKTIQKMLYTFQSVGGVEYNYTQLDPINNQDGGISGGNIRSVILYRSDSGIELDHSLEVMNENPVRIGENSQEFIGSRKPLIALFRKGEAKIMVIGVHLTSRGADSPLFGSMQPINQPELAKRVAQARYISNYVAGKLQNHSDLIIFVAGDMNDLPWSDTVSALKGRNLVDPGNLLQDSERFSYIFEGNGIQLDYIFINSNAHQGVKEYAIYHLNSIYDHTLQVSDHDPVILGVDLD